MKDKRSIFVTVGTTLFDPLIETVSSPRFLDIISSRSYGDVTVQYGKGDETLLPPLPSSSSSTTKRDSFENDAESARFHSYRFKSSLEEDMSSADLIISHAGAGSIMEGLSNCRLSSAKTTKLVVVVNSRLMNNHQQELAGALARRGHLICLPEPEHLLDERVWRDEIDEWEALPFPEGDGGKDFALLVDSCLGFS